MIKIFKHLSIWIVISLVTQFGVLYYIDKYYLKTQTTFKIEKVVTQVPKQQEVSINIPQDATKINASYDGKFISYCESDGLKTLDTTNGQIRVVTPDKGNKILFYNWVSDRHRLIIAEDPAQGSGAIQLKSYDADKGIKNNVNNNITWSNNYTTVADIQISQATNLIYVKVNRNSYKSEIYENDVMNDVSKINTTSSRIGDIKIIPNADELVYEDLYSNRIVSTSDKVSMNFNNIQKPVILGADDDNNIYVGNVVNGLITNIYYGQTDAPTSQWQSVKAPNGLDPNNLLVTENGDIYVNDNLKGQVTALKTNQMTSYRGTLIKMTDSEILSQENGKLLKTTYK
jgi:hypothetical protein